MSKRYNGDGDVEIVSESSESSNSQPDKHDIEAVPEVIISHTTLTFDDAPSLNPQNWPGTRKLLILAIGINLIVNSTSASSLASVSVGATMAEFGLPSYQAFTVLPTSTFLAGYFFGNVMLAPLSEIYGRRPVNLATFSLFGIWMMACALAPNWASFNIFRALTGFFAAGPSSTISGICADLYQNDMRRGDALLAYNMLTSWGPVLGPIISGFAVQINWRLSFWVGLAYAVASFLPLLWMPETNHCTILANHAKRLRKADGGPDIYGPFELVQISWKDMLGKKLFRPVVMFYTEPVVFFTCLYIAFQYAVFYTFLESYPIVYEDIYSFSEGQTGLVFLAFGTGVLLTWPIQICFERYYLRAKKQEKAWAQHHGARRLPVACLSGPLVVIGLFWSAWTSRKSISWGSSALSGIPFGLGYTLIDNSLVNYLVDCYTSYASSANGAAVSARQFMGTALPFAAIPMYRALGVGWATSVLGFVALVMSLVPFVFWIFGERILKASKWAQRLVEEERQCQQQ